MDEVTSLATLEASKLLLNFFRAVFTQTSVRVSSVLIQIYLCKFVL